jgi:hypothetical protein
MKKYSLHICFLLFLFPALAGTAQAKHGPSAKTPLSISVTADQQHILIGQPIHLLLELIATGNAPVAFPAMDSLPHFEFLEKGNIDSVIRPDGRYYRQSFTVTSFDSGAWAIPRLLFSAGVKKAFSDSLRIEVGFSKFDPNKDYHDIRDIIDVPNPYAKWFGWIIAGISLLSLALVIWMVGRKKLIPAPAPPPEAAAPSLPPYEEALACLDELAAQTAWENVPVKTYYTRLNDILRLFILRRLGIASLAETNEELIGQLRRLPLDPGAFTRLAEAMRMSDFVKFAKYQPGLADKEESYHVIRSSVEGLNRIATQREIERLASIAAVKENARDGDAEPHGDGNNTINKNNTTQ